MRVNFLFLVLGAMLLSFLPQAVSAGSLDDKMATYYLTEGASPSGLALTPSFGTTRGWQPTRTLSDKSLTWYTAPLTGDITGGKWALNLWMARLHKASTVKVEILKTDAKGGHAVVLGSEQKDMPVNYLHHDLPTIFVNVGPTTFKNELLAVRLTKGSGADVVVGFNANDYDSNLVILSKPPTPPPGAVMTFTFRNCTNVLTDDQISWTFNGKTYHKLSEGLVIPAGTRSAARMYVRLNFPKAELTGLGGKRTVYSDFVEYNLGKAGMFVNTTQVDALVVPLTIELVDASGRSVAAGMSESMPSLIEKFKKETPKEFHAYIRNNQINQPNGLPGITQGGSPASCAAINRNVSGADAKNPDKYYLKPPCNYYAKFMHDHSLNGKAYGFAYDDYNQQDTLLISRSPVNMIVSIYWADAPTTTKKGKQLP